MIRVIIKTKWKDRFSTGEGEYFKTVDIDAPELEAALKQGGMDMDQYSIPQVIGVEILEANRG